MNGMKPHEMFPKQLIKELRRLSAIRRDWLNWSHCDENNNPEGRGYYRCCSHVDTLLERSWTCGNDAFLTWGISEWIADGPKTFFPTLEQCQAMSEVEVRVNLADYSQPFPAILIALPKGAYGSLYGVIAHLSGEGERRVASFSGVSPTGIDDFTNVIGCDKAEFDLEHYIKCWDDDFRQNYSDMIPMSIGSLRIAINCCLALSNYGCHLEYLLKKDADRDKQLAREKSERGHRAKERLKDHVQQIILDRDVVLHRTEVHASTGSGESGGSGREMSTHWRRGHWHTVLHGLGKTQRKLKLYPPVLVRADLAVDGQQGSTNYRG